MSIPPEPALTPARDRIDRYGEMAERFKAAVSKTVVGASSTVGSNPTLSARHRTRQRAGRGNVSSGVAHTARRGAGVAERARLEIV